ncbi:MAG: adenylate/guanylate cyclase domain-containing protein [Reyranella sp.]|nr:adenylate/guanylate cyclase domain-containing protein [Reyranella sp.]
MVRKRSRARAATTNGGGRRLVVVAAFDVVNFTALVEADEERVLAAWRALRAEIDPLIAAGGGRIFKALGDGLLVEFTGPIDATRTALLVQETVARTAAGQDAAVRLELRCAIHMGEVTLEGTDLLGDGINIVSRLQAHAPIGGVLVSAAVMDLISGRLSQPIEELGPITLRNMSRPVHTYAVGPKAPGARGGMIDSFQRRRPSIAVLPFVDQSEDEGASWFSDGLVEAIIAALACLPELIVISRSSVLRYRGQAHDPERVRRELSVRYMLTGSVRRVSGPGGDKVRLSAELSDCETGTAIWSDRFAGAAADLFQLQDELSARVVTTIAPQVQESELRRVLKKHPESLDAYESVLRGLDLLYRVEDDPWAKALPLFERAMTLDPSYAAAYALAATCHGERFYEGTSPDPTADHLEAERLSRLALSYDRFDPLALSLCGHIRSWLFHDYDHAIELFDRALAANPSAAIAWLRSSATFSYIGETREARRRVEIGLRLSPYDAHVFFSYGLAGLAAYAGGDYIEAANWARKSMALNPRFVGNLRFLAASLAASGQFKEAHEVGRALLRVNPAFSARKFAAGHAFKDAEKRRLFGDHLVMAGLPE